MTSKQPVKVFISYSQDSPEHMDRVLELSDRLCSDGVDCIIDQYETFPPEGWPCLTKRQIEKADFVLLVYTETYHKRFEGTEDTGTGLGVKWEGAIITQKLYDAEAQNTRFIPVLFSAHDSVYIPDVLRGASRFDLSSNYEALYRLVTNQPRVEKPDIGRAKSMQPRNRKKDFLHVKVRSSLFDLTESLLPI